MPSVKLTDNSILTLTTGPSNLAGAGFHPILQVIGQLAHLLSSKQVMPNTIVQLKEYIVQWITSGRPEANEKSLVCIVMSLDVVEQAPHRIGDPVQIPGAVDSGAGTHGAQPMPQQSVPGSVPMQAPQNAYGAPQQLTTGAYGRPPQTTYGQAPQGAATYGQPQAGHALPGSRGEGGSSPYTAQAQPYQAQPAGMYGAPGAANTPYGAEIPSRYDNRGGAVARNIAPSHYTRIKDVSAYVSRWTIKGRVTSKGELKRYNKGGNEGCVFNFDLSDASGEVRVVAFKDVAEKFFDKVHMGKCYTLTKASAKPMDAGKRKWNQTGHDCELYLDHNSELDEVPDDPSTVELPRVHLKLIKIADIEMLEAGTVCDIMGVLESCGDWSTINRRDGTEARKRGFVLKDDSNRTVEVTLWGEKCDTPGNELFEAAKAGRPAVVCIKSARVGDFNGKTLSTIASSTILIDPPDVDGADRLRTWFLQGGSNVAPQALSVPGKGGRSDQRMTVADIKAEGSENLPKWVKLFGHLSSIRTDPMTYPACWADFNGRKCQKKMTESGDGTGSFYCERCGVTAMPKWRYILQLTFGDFTGQLDNVSVFGELGEEVVGLPAEQAHEIEEAARAGVDTEMSNLLERCSNRPKVFKVKIALDTYNDEARVKHTLAGCEAPDFVVESQTLIGMIDDLLAGRPIGVMQPKPMAASTSFGGSANGGNFGATGMAGGYGSMATGASSGGFGASPYGSAQPVYGGGGFTAAPAAGGYQQQAPAAFLNHSAYGRGY